MNIVANRYELVRKLGEGGMGAVYEAYDRLNKQAVAFKQVQHNTPQTALDSMGMRVALTHEFQVLASLHHPHIISVQDYGFDENRQPYFTMSLLNNPQTIIQAGRNLAVQDKVRLLIQMLQALAYLHRRGIIHRDLKPDNALVDEHGQVRVLDFGIALPEVNAEENDQLAGTLTYIAPEILRGEPVSTSSDLYAVGVMAYELFAGRHPFDTSSTQALLESVLMLPPNLNALQTGILASGDFPQQKTDLYETIADDVTLMDVDTIIVSDYFEKMARPEPVSTYLPEAVENPLLSVIQKLLAKNPYERYPDADSTIAALSAATHQPVPQESTAIRESFLQAARFVGREKEFGQLMNALEDALDNRGGTWLIGGESGVGKSRLLDELRTQALVRGAWVLRGQGVAEGGLPYQLWREPLRRLILATDISLGEASVLKYIVPDIEDLLQTPVPDAPDIEGPAWRQRLLNAIGEVFRQQRHPTLLILEDLQWGLESLEVLKHLLIIDQDLPLLIIGSYRDDERPDLPQELSDVQVIKLERLKEDSIEQLSVSMLGEAGRQPELLDLLRRETEGNVFFLVEVVRAMAEEAGRLSDIGQMNLPQQVSAGGIQQVIQRRLGRVPDTARPLLNLAAVAGRLLDLKLLQQLMPAIDISTWLAECSNVAVLEAMEGQWRFTHDKLREGLLRSLDEAQRREFHFQVAEALASLYHDQDDYAMIISDHYEQASADSEAVRWCVRAGLHAQASYVPQTAITYYQKALTYWQSLPPASLSEQMKVYDGLGMMLNWQARYEEAVQIFQAQAALAEKHSASEEQVNGLYGIAYAYTNQGDLRTAIEYLSQAEPIARQSDANHALSRILWLRGVNMYRLGDAEATFALSQEVRTISHTLGNRSQEAQSLNLMGAVQYALGDYRQAADLFEQAYEIFVELGERAQAVSLVNNLGFLAEARGDYDVALIRYTEALRIAREIGIRDAEMLYLSNLGGVKTKLGDFLAAELDLREVIALAETAPFGQLSETYRFLGVAMLGQGYRQDALQAAQKAMELGQAVGGTEYVAGAWGVLGQVAAQLQQPITIEEKAYSAEACFQQASQHYQESGMEGDRARVLREWAKYELTKGDTRRAADLWAEAKAIFLKIGAELEVTRHSHDMPLE